MWTAARSTPKSLLSLYFSRASSNRPAGKDVVVLRIEYKTIQNGEKERGLTGFQDCGMIEGYFGIFGREGRSNSVGCRVTL